MTSQLPANTEDIPLDRCWELLTQQRVARLAVVHQGEPDIFPVSYIVDHGGIVFRTGAGTKLAAASGHPVALEVDGEDEVQGHVRPTEPARRPAGSLTPPTMSTLWSRRPIRNCSPITARHPGSRYNGMGWRGQPALKRMSISPTV